MFSSRFKRSHYYYLLIRLKSNYSVAIINYSVTTLKLTAKVCSYKNKECHFGPTESSWEFKELIALVQMNNSDVVTILINIIHANINDEQVSPFNDVLLFIKVVYSQPKKKNHGFMIHNVCSHTGIIIIS